jgi:hypothetical protein
VWEAIPARLLGSGWDANERTLPFNMSDGTIGSWLGLAHGIGQKKAMQSLFRRVMYMGGDDAQ